MKRDRYAPGVIASHLDHLGIEYRDVGGELQALCPNKEHDDHSPSWSINTESGLHHCFACGYKGNLRSLYADFGYGKPDTSYQAADDKFRVNRSLDVPKPDDDEAPRPVSESVMALFEQVPIDVLEERSLSRASADLYSVGWDPKTESWILPFYSSDLVFMGYQSKSRTGKVFRNYPRGISKASTLFGIRALAAEGEVVVVESPLDAVRLYGLGYPALAVCGSSLSDQQLTLLQRYDSVVFAMDNDEAGRKEHARLSRAGLWMYHSFIDYEDLIEKDVGEMTDEKIRQILSRP